MRQAISTNTRGSVANYLTATMTVVAGAGCTHLSQYGVGNALNLAAAMANRAGFKVQAFSRYTAPYLYFLFCAAGNFFQGEFHLNPKVAATGTLAAALKTTATKAAKTTTAKVSAKDVAKHAKDVIHIHVLATTKSSGSGCKCLVPELIIFLAFLRIAKHFVGFCSLFKLFFGFFIVRVAVWVVFQCRFAVGFLYLLFAGVLANPQNIVVIAFCHSFFFFYCVSS